MPFWGTENTDSISLYIYDFYDDSTKGIVYFEPIWIPEGSYISSGIQGYKEKLIQSIKIKRTVFREFAEIEIYTISKSKFELKIYDVTGRKIKEIKNSLEPGINRFKLKDFKKGVYFLELKVDKKKKIFKILKV